MVSGAGLEEGRDHSLFLDMRLSLEMHLFLDMLFVMNSSGDAVQAGGFELGVQGKGLDCQHVF